MARKNSRKELFLFDDSFINADKGSGELYQYSDDSEYFIDSAEESSFYDWNTD